MHPSHTISHRGIVRENQRGLLKVSLINTGGCASCHVKGACGVADLDNKVLEISAPGHFQAGDEVEVRFSPSMEFKALFLGYMAPFLLMLATLFAELPLWGELKAGLAALAILVPYYAGLSLFGQQLKKTFSFSIKKT